MVQNSAIWTNQTRRNRVPKPLPEELLDLLRKPSPCFVATLMPDGTPQVTPVWVDYDGSRVILNSARGRRKDKNMKKGASVAIAIMDPDNAYRYLEVRGRVVEVTEQGAYEHIDRMAKKYLGQDKYPFRQPGEVRVIYKVEPSAAKGM